MKSKLFLLFYWLIGLAALLFSFLELSSEAHLGELPYRNGAFGLFNRGNFRFGWSWSKDLGRNVFGPHEGRPGTPGHWHSPWFSGPREPARTGFTIGGGAAGGAAGSGGGGGGGGGGSSCSCK